ncbi:uncharacterized protein LOC127788228 [Diospyros lotus]|uniref:uncharacterized protein LOC127788228 n=1 Tax=Diospyros lotus TaxID=55363 RepID=UPI00225A208C|nr:uncharacterized protein LOC127788228 [Diospyros lotus]
MVKSRRPVFVVVMYGGQWQYDVDAKEYKYMTEEFGSVLRVEPDCTLDQLVSSLYSKFNVSTAEKSVVLKYKYKHSVPSALPLEIRNDTDVECFLLECSRIESRSPLCVDFVDRLLPRTEPKEVVAENSPLKCLGIDSPTSLKDEVNRDDALDGNGYEDVKRDDAGHGFEDAFNADDAENLYIINVDSRDCAKQPTFLPSLRLSRVSAGTSSAASDVELNEIFSSKSKLHERMSLLALKNNYEYRVVKLTKKVVYMKCKHGDCKWRLRAATLGTSFGWTVRKYVNTHSCSSSIMCRDHCQAKSRIIGSYIKSSFDDVKRIYKPKNIVHDIRKDFGVNISYEKAWRSREKALDMIRGGAEESFQLLPSYLYMLKLNNPGTIAEFESDSRNRFKYLFMAIGACLAGFRSKMRPVIAVDACFLKGKYLGSLFVATCKDGNNHVYPIVWGVGDSENDASWEWFFNKLRSALGDDTPDLVFVSDRHKSIHKAVTTVFPNSLHVSCIYHIGQNIKAKFKKENVHALFYKAAKAYRQSEFNEYFIKLKRYAPAIGAYLREAGFSRWARAYSDGKRFDIMSTNIAECLNAALADERKLPIQCLMEYIRNMLQQWFYERRGDASKMGGYITTWAEGEIGKRLALSRNWRPEPIDMYRFNVHDGHFGGIVDLKVRTCTCKVFDFDKLPCGHALAAARSRNIHPYSLCSSYYQTEALLCAYADPIMPVGSQADWTVPAKIAFIKLLSPANRRKRGRRQICRIPSSGEEKRRVKCSRCGLIGHNRQTCSNPITLLS